MTELREKINEAREKMAKKDDMDIEELRQIGTELQQATIKVRFCSLLMERGSIPLCVRAGIRAGVRAASRQRTAATTTTEHRRRGEEGGEVE